MQKICGTRMEPGVEPEIEHGTGIKVFTIQQIILKPYSFNENETIEFDIGKIVIQFSTLSTLTRLPQYRTHNLMHQ